MFLQYPERCVVYFAMDFPFVARQKHQDFLDAVQLQYQPEKIVSQTNSTTFCWPQKRRRIAIAWNRIHITALGLHAWNESYSDHMDMLKTGSNVLGLEELKRIGLKVTTFLPLELSQAEMIDLFFGSVLTERETLEKSLGIKVDDPFVQLDGATPAGNKCQLYATSASIENIQNELNRVPGLEQFIQRNVFGDEELRSFLHTAAAREALLFDIDISSSEKTAADADGFISEAMSSADEICTKFVRSLQSKPAK